MSPLSYGKIFENPIGNGDFNWEKRNAMTRSVYGTGYADGDYWMCSSPPGGTLASCSRAYLSKYTKWAGSGKYTSYYTTGYNSDGTLSSNYVTGSNYKTAGRTCVRGIDGAFIRIKFPHKIYPNDIYIISGSVWYNCSAGIRKMHVFASIDNWKTQTQLAYTDNFWVDETWQYDGTKVYQGDTIIMPNGGSYKGRKFHVFDESNTCAKKNMFDEYALIVPEAVGTTLHINAFVVMGQKEGNASPSNVNLDAHQLWPSESIHTGTGRWYNSAPTYHMLPYYSGGGAIEIITERTHGQAGLHNAFNLSSPSTDRALCYSGGTNTYIDNGNGEYVWEGGIAQQTSYLGYLPNDYPGGYISVKLPRRIYPTKISIIHGPSRPISLEFMLQMIFLLIQKYFYMKVLMLI